MKNAHFDHDQYGEIITSQDKILREAYLNVQKHITLASWPDDEGNNFNFGLRIALDEIKKLMLNKNNAVDF
jgi:hypothetical protein